MKSILLSRFISFAFFGGLALFIPACADGRDDVVLPSCDNIHWEYEGQDGPDAWSNLCVDYVTCGGQIQSPVDISAAVEDAGLAAIPMDYQSSTTHILNNGHTLQWSYDAGSSIEVDGVAYQLLQFHSHTESEHRVNGLAYPLELHFVHKNTMTGKLAVIGVFFEEGAENAVLQGFIDHLPADHDATYESAATFNAGDLFPTDPSYFTYSGSLTTPPCSEIVTWIVLEQAVEASAAQIDRFRQIELENHRPLQPLHGRVIRYFEG
jgi:carbonic anhydrase